MSSTFDFSVRRRDVVWAVALVVLLSAIWVARSDQADAGVPPGTGIARVYIATGANFPDALGVGPGAGLDGAPIIIVPTNPPIPTLTANELARLDPRTVVVVGGTSAVSQAMEDALENLLPNADFLDRIAGANRYETNAMFSAATFPIEGWAAVNAAAFTALTYGADVEISQTGAGNASGAALYAAIQLPHGAEILELRAVVNDTHANNVTVNLNRVLTTAVLISSLTSSGTPGDVEISTTGIAQGGLEIVDNATYTYSIEILLSTGNPSPFVRGVMVRYRIGTSGG